MGAARVSVFAVKVGDSVVVVSISVDGGNCAGCSWIGGDGTVTVDVAVEITVAVVVFETVDAEEVSDGAPSSTGARADVLGVQKRAHGFFFVFFVGIMIWGIMLDPGLSTSFDSFVNRFHCGLVRSRNVVEHHVWIEDHVRERRGVLVLRGRCTRTNMSEVNDSPRLNHEIARRVITKFEADDALDFAPSALAFASPVPTPLWRRRRCIFQDIVRADAGC
jgi:hypothetical protein